LYLPGDGAELSSSLVCCQVCARPAQERHQTPDSEIRHHSASLVAIRADFETGKHREYERRTNTAGAAESYGQRLEIGRYWDAEKPNRIEAR